MASLRVRNLGLMPSFFIPVRRTRGTPSLASSGVAESAPEAEKFATEVSDSRLDRREQKDIGRNVGGKKGVAWQDATGKELCAIEEGIRKNDGEVIKSSAWREAVKRTVLSTLPRCHFLTSRRRSS
jgi:hypothetical protein